MHEEVKNPSKKDAKNKRDERLHEALRANLSKRKRQNRNREADPSDTQTGNPPPPSSDGDAG